MSRRARWLIAGLVLVVAAVVALWPRGDDAPEPAATQPGADLAQARQRAALAPCTAPSAGRSAALAGVRAECLADGAPVDLSGVLAGRVVLINVWATWCQPCKEELPVLAGYAAQPGAVPVIGVALNSPPADALGLLANLGVRYPNVNDPQGTVLRALGDPGALPASYVIESDGTVHFVTDPRLFRSADQVRQTVARYLPPDGSGRS